MKIVLENILTILENISEQDAKMICKVRNDPSINKFLSTSNEISEDDQREWIRLNLKKNNGIYFKILDKPTLKFLGTISIYNVNNTLSEAEFGRYICKGSLHAIEAELMILRWGFEIMRLKKIYCRTANDNYKVWGQHYKFGFLDSGFETLEGKEMLLKKQEITNKTYEKFNYQNIIDLIKRFA